MTDSPPPIIDAHRLEPKDQMWFDAGALPTNQRITDGLIRHSALELQDWSRLHGTVVALENEARSSSKRRRKASMYFELFRIFETELNDENRALQCLQRAFHADERHLPTLWAGRRVFGRVGRWSMVVRLLESEVRATSVPSRKARALKEMGEVYLAHFGRPQEAQQCFLAAHRFEEGAGIVAVDCLHACKLTDKAHADMDVVTTLGHDSRDRVWTQGVCALTLGDFVRAGEYQTALDIASSWPRTVTQHLAVRQVLFVAHRALGQLDEAVRIIMTGLKQMPDAEQRSGILRSLAYWCASSTNIGVDEVDLLETVVALRPQCADGWFQLARAQDRRGDVREALGAFREAFNLQTCPVLERMSVFQVAYRSTELGEYSLESRAVIDKWVALVGSNPVLDHIGDSHLLKLGDWQGLYARVKARYTLSRGSERGYQAWLAGVICWLKLDELNDARRWFELAHAAYPSAPIVQLARFSIDEDSEQATADDELSRVCTQLVKWAQGHQVFQSDVGGQAHPRGMLNQVVSALCQPILAADLAQWWPVLQSYIEYFPADTVAQHFEVFGLYDVQLQAHWPAIKTRQARIETDSGARACWLGWCAYDNWRLGNKYAGRAQDALEEALILTPDAPELLTLGIDIAELSGQRESAGEWSVALAQGMTDHIWKAELLADAAQAHLTAEDRAGLAIDLLQRALDHHAGCIMARTSLFDIGRKMTDLERAGEILRPLARTAYQAHDAEVTWLELAEKGRRDDATDEAVSAAEEAAEWKGASLHHLFILERIGLAARSPEALIGVYDRMLKHIRDPRIQCELLLKKGRVLERSGDFYEAAQVMRRCLKVAPDTPAAIEWFARWVDETGDLELLAEILGPLMRGRLDDSERAEFLMEAGRALRLAGRGPEAKQCFEAVLKMAGERLIPIRYLRTSALEDGDIERSATLFEREARIAQNAQNRAMLYGEAGKTFLALKQDTQALDAYCAALNAQPGQIDVIGKVRMICERRGAWSTWADVIQTIPCTTLAEAEEVALEAASIFQDRLKSPRDAIEVLERIVHAHGQTSVKVIQTLADLYTDDERWEDAASMYRQLTTVSLDETLRRSVSFRLATICANHLSDAESAMAILRGILDDDPSNTAALDRLASLELASGNLLSARLVLTRAINAAKTSVERADYRRRLAELDLSDNRPDVALAGLRLAVEDAADSAMTYEVMADVFEQTDAVADQAAALRSAIELTKSPEQRQRLSSKLLGSMPPADRGTDGVAASDDIARIEVIEPLTEPLSVEQLQRQADTFRRHDLNARADAVEDFIDGLTSDSVRQSERDDGSSAPSYPIAGLTFPRLWETLDRRLIEPLAELADCLPAKFRQAPLGGIKLTLNRSGCINRPWLSRDFIRVLPLPVHVCFLESTALCISRRLLELPLAERKFWSGCQDVFMATRCEFFARWTSEELVLFLSALGRIARLVSESEIDARCRNLAHVLTPAVGDLATEGRLLRPLGQVLERLDQLHDFDRQIWRCAVRHGLLVCESPSSAARALRNVSIGQSEEDMNAWRGRLSELSRWICSGGANSWLSQGPT